MNQLGDRLDLGQGYQGVKDLAPGCFGRDIAEGFDGRVFGDGDRQWNVDQFHRFDARGKLAVENGNCDIGFLLSQGGFDFPVS